MKTTGWKFRLAAAVLALGAAGAAQAATWTLGSGTGYWTNSANWSTAAVPGPADDVLFTNGTATVTLTADVTINSLNITNTFTGTLTFSTGVSAGLYVANDLYVKTNATLQCTYSSTNGNGTGRVITVGGNAVVNGTITADSLGFPDAQGPGAGANNAGGASHGGRGSRNVAPYGSLTQPTSLGSGGNSSAGGGAVMLVVSNSLTLNGSISARAAAGHDAGSGGSIWLIASNFAGVGSLNADGGNWSGTGSGAGGRIAVAVTNSTFSGSVTAAGGMKPADGSIASPARCGGRATCRRQET